jgi:hypothetical protein
LTTSESPTTPIISQQQGSEKVEKPGGSQLDEREAKIIPTWACWERKPTFRAGDEEEVVDDRETLQVIECGTLNIRLQNEFLKRWNQ